MQRETGHACSHFALRCGSPPNKTPLRFSTTATGEGTVLDSEAVVPENGDTEWKRESNGMGQELVNSKTLWIDLQKSDFWYIYFFI